MEKYSVQQVSELFKVSDRAIVKRCKKANIRLRNGKYLIPADILENWTEAREKRNRNKNINRTKNIVPIQVPIEVPIETENIEVTSSENIVPIKVPMQVVNEAEKKEHLKIIESLKRETLQLKKEVEILRASTRFAIDNIRDMQGKENMTTTMQKIAEAKKLKVVPEVNPNNDMNEMLDKIKEERKDNKKLQKEPIMNSVHFQSSYNRSFKRE